MSLTIRTRKFMRNSLLSRRQMIVDVIHDGKRCASHAELGKELARIHNADSKLVFLFNFRTVYGGGKTTGFCLIYDNLKEAEKFEPQHRLRNIGLGTPIGDTRKAKKEAKGRKKRTWGTGRRAALHKQKKAARDD